MHSANAILSLRQYVDWSKTDHPTTIASEQEDKLVEYACNQASMGVDFGHIQFLKYAGNFAKKHHTRLQTGRLTVSGQNFGHFSAYKKKSI